MLRLRPALRARRIRDVRRAHDQRRCRARSCKLETDDGLAGYGETCPLGSTYLPAHAGGARAALRELAPALIGRRSRATSTRSGDAMDGALRGPRLRQGGGRHRLLGPARQGRRACPVSTLLGGATQPPTSRSTSRSRSARSTRWSSTCEARRAEGIRRFQLKLGADPREDAARVRAVLEATEAGDDDHRRRQRRLAPAGRDDRRARARGPRPRALRAAVPDARGVPDRPRAHDAADGARRGHHRRRRAAARAAARCEAINLKIGRVGGLTKAKLMRDLGQRLGLRFTIEDSWGGDVTTAAVAHLAASTTPDAAADGELHERLDARPHRGLRAAQPRRPRRARRARQAWASPSTTVALTALTTVD